MGLKCSQINPCWTIPHNLRYGSLPEAHLCLCHHFMGKFCRGPLFSLSSFSQVLLVHQTATIPYDIRQKEDLLMFPHPVQNKDYDAVVASSYELCHQPVISFLQEDRQEVVHLKDQVGVIHLLPNPFWPGLCHLFAIMFKGDSERLKWEPQVYH